MVEVKFNGLGWRIFDIIGFFFLPIPCRNMELTAIGASTHLPLFSFCCIFCCMSVFLIYVLLISSERAIDAGWSSFV